MGYLAFYFLMLNLSFNSARQHLTTGTETQKGLAHAKDENCLLCWYDLDSQGRGQRSKYEPKSRSKYGKARIAYYVGNGTQTFQLQRACAALVLVSGDI